MPGRNSIKGETPLVLSDGREFTLVLDMEALVSVEDTTGKPLGKVMSQASQGFVGAMAAIAHAAFTRHHPEVTREEVLRMAMGDEEVLSQALGHAVEAAYPDEVGNAPAAKPSPSKSSPRGKRSGRSGAKRV